MFHFIILLSIKPLKQFNCELPEVPVLDDTVFSLYILKLISIDNVSVEVTEALFMRGDGKIFPSDDQISSFKKPSERGM